MVRLILEDGAVFHGKSFGAECSISGEIVFNTGMVGYPETLTDPSYKGQILVLTYPMIGNYGVPGDKVVDGLSNFESDKIQIQGLVVLDYSKNYHHWNAAKSLGEWLKEHNVPGMHGVDTREITKKLRHRGVMLGKIENESKVDLYDPNKENLVAQVSCKEPIVYERGSTKVMLVDTGVKHNIIRSFLKRDVTVIRVPWDYDFLESDYEFDGLFLSNGPGDPKMCRKTIKHTRDAMKSRIPIFGICLGNQILALAAGADTYKLKFGHRSQNQPCVMVGSKRCFITSQNHGFAVNEKTLPAKWEPWFVNVNDGTNEGIKHKTKPFMSVQFHPEATPGPVDTEFMFDDYVKMLRK